METAEYDLRDVNCVSYPCTSHNKTIFSANDAITLYAFTTFEQYIERITGLLIFESSFMLKSKDTDHIFFGGGEVGSKVWHFPSSSGH